MDWWKLFTEEWLPIVKVVVGSFAGSGVGTLLVQWYPGHLERKQQAGYFALCIARKLENYAYECQSFIWENDDAEREPGREFPDWNTSLPKLALPEDNDTNWKIINYKLVEKCQDFPGTISERQSVVSHYQDHSPDVLEASFKFESANLGLTALKIADYLRSKYGKSREKSYEKIIQELVKFFESERDKAKRVFDKP